MSTEITLDGAMGNKFGRKWNLCVESPAEALRLIACNEPGLPVWIRDNLQKFEGYEVTCEYDNGLVDVINADELYIQGKLISIRFTPILIGSGKGANIGMIVLGVALLAAAVFFAPAAVAAFGSVGMTTTAGTIGLMGAGLLFGGVVGLLTAQPSLSTSSSSKNSYYFDGPINTAAQGNPVSLIYGFNVKVGSQVISASLTVDDISGDIVAPTIINFNPSNNATNVSRSTNIIITFSESIRVGKGVAKLSFGNTSFKEFDVATSSLVNTQGPILTINILGGLSANTNYSLSLPSGSITDYANNNFTGATYSFTTGAS